jgi:hypothetical protein
MQEKIINLPLLRTEQGRLDLEPVQEEDIRHKSKFPSNESASTQSKRQTKTHKPIKQFILKPNTMDSGQLQKSHHS